MNTQGIVIRCDATIETCELGYQSIRAAIGNLLDFRQVNEVAGFYLDDEGLINESPLNVVASMVAGSAFFGTVVVVAADTDDEGDTLPMVDGDFRAFIDHVGERWRYVLDSAKSAGQDVQFIPNSGSVPPPVITELTDQSLDAFLRGHGL